MVVVTCVEWEEVDVECHEIEEEESWEVQHGGHGLHADESEHFAQPHEWEEHEGKELVGKELEKEKQDADHDLEREEEMGGMGGGCCAIRRVRWRGGFVRNSIIFMKELVCCWKEIRALPSFKNVYNFRRYKMRQARWSKTESLQHINR